MIVGNLTEDFVENHYFVLEKSYSTSLFTDSGHPTDKYIDLEVGSEWQITDDNYIDGDIHLVGQNLWIELSEETFREYFSAHEWIISNNRANMSLEDMLCEMYSACSNEEELEDKYNEIRSISACCLERRAEEIGLDPDTVGY